MDDRRVRANHRLVMIIAREKSGRRSCELQPRSPSPTDPNQRPEQHKLKNRQATQHTGPTSGRRRRRFKPGEFAHVASVRHQRPSRPTEAVTGAAISRWEQLSAAGALTVDMEESNQHGLPFVLLAHVEKFHAAMADGRLDRAEGALSQAYLALVQISLPDAERRRALKILNGCRRELTRAERLRPTQLQRRTKRSQGADAFADPTPAICSRCGGFFDREGRRKVCPACGPESTSPSVRAFSGGLPTLGKRRR
jgi:hypothetical protein